MFRPSHEPGDQREFAIDLCSDSSPNMIVVARIAQPATLQEAIERVEQCYEERQPEKGSEQLGFTDVLLVPDIVFQLQHRFAELEGTVLTNEKLGGRHIATALQDIEFRLDRSGAELASQAKDFVKSDGDDYVFDHPFLVIMGKRKAKSPFLVLWIGNAELLKPW